MHDDCAFCEGSKAFTAGKSVNDNPHEPGTDTHDIWEDGYTYEKGIQKLLKDGRR